MFIKVKFKQTRKKKKKIKIWAPQAIHLGHTDTWHSYHAQAQFTAKV